MSESVLRQAASELRATVNGCGGDPTLVSDPEFKLAVADWLVSAADGWVKEQDRQWGLALIGHDWQIPEGTSKRNEIQRKCDAAADVRFKKAIAAATAYLGESA